MIETIEPFTDILHDSIDHYEWISKVPNILRIAEEINDEFFHIYNNSDIAIHLPDIPVFGDDFVSYCNENSKQDVSNIILKYQRQIRKWLPVIKQEWDLFPKKYFSKTLKYVKPLILGPSESDCKSFENELDQWDDFGPKTSQQLQSLMTEISENYSKTSFELKRSLEVVRETQLKVFNLLEQIENEIESVNGIFLRGRTPDVFNLDSYYDKMRKLIMDTYKEIEDIPFHLSYVDDHIETMKAIRKTMLDEVPSLMICEPPTYDEVIHESSTE